MIASAHVRGAADALAYFGVKTAGPFIEGLKRNLIGRPGELFVEGPRALGHTGSLSLRNVFWPAVSGPGGSKFNWLNRGATAMGALGVARALTSDRDEGRLSNALGGLGGIAGMAYGHHALGMLGAPLASGAGMALGRGLGNLISG